MRRPTSGRVRSWLRAASAVVVGIVAWSLVAALLAQVSQGLALAWVYLAPLSVAGWAFRKEVSDTLRRLPHGLKVPSSDLLALLVGTVLLAPSVQDTYGVPWLIAAVTCVVVLFVGILILGNRDRIQRGITVTTQDWDERPLAAWAFHGFLAFLRSPSTLGTVYVTMAAVTMLDTPPWVPTLVAILAALLYWLLEVITGSLPRTPARGAQKHGTPAAPPPTGPPIDDETSHSPAPFGGDVTTTGRTTGETSIT